MTEIDRIPVEGGEIVDPRTGEILDSRDVPAVVDVLVYLRQVKHAVTEGIAALTAAIVEESERSGTKTFTVGGGKKARLAGGTEIVWDIEILERLKDEGLPESRWTELVTVEVSYKVNVAVAKQIAGANAVYAEIIEQARTDVPKKTYVTVGK